MDEREFEKLIKSIDTKVVLPPEGLKEKLLAKTMALGYKEEFVLTPFERFLYEKPLRAACVIALAISCSLWAVLGSSFVKVFIGSIG